MLAYLIELCQEFVWICTFKEVHDICFVKESVFLQIRVLITSCLFLFSVNKLLKRADLLASVRILTISMNSLDVLKSILWVQKSLVNCASFIAHTDHENLSWLRSRSWGLRRLNFGEELVEHKEEWVVILRTENLCHESATFLKDLSGKFDRVQRQLNLHVGI